MVQLNAKNLCYVLLLLQCSLSSSFVAPTARPFGKILTLTRTRTDLGANLEQDNEESFPSRRNFMSSVPLLLFGRALPAHASLVQFPCKSGLMNTYHFMRAGQSLLEEQGIWSTNPLFITNRENALSDQGRNQVQDACRLMEQNNLNPSVLKFSLAANAMDTADIISMQLQVGRNRLVPEYTYLDQRGIGRWDGLPLQSTREAVWAMDVKEAGKEGLGGRPPAHEDGTPNETLGNQVTRLRQLISLLETSLSGDDILLVFPDGTGPAVLSCLIAGIPLDRVHEIEYNPGELRFDINYNSVRAMMPAAPSAEYVDAIQRGSVQLADLRSQDPQEILNVKEQRYEAEVIAMKQKEERQNQMKALEEEEKQRVLQRRREEAEASRQERMKQREADRQRRGDEAIAARKHTSNGPMDAVAVAGLGAASIAAVMLKSPDDDTTAATGESSGTAVGEEVEKSGELDQIGSLAAVDANVINNETATLEAELEKEKSMSSFTLEDTDQELAAAELIDLEKMVEQAPIEIPEFPQNKSPSPEQRADAAKRAMQQYLDQDDGGEAWLGAMSELMAEDD